MVSLSFLKTFLCFLVPYLPSLAFRHAKSLGTQPFHCDFCVGQECVARWRCVVISYPAHTEQCQLMTDIRLYLSSRHFSKVGLGLSNDCLIFLTPRHIDCLSPHSFVPSAQCIRHFFAELFKPIIILSNQFSEKNSLTHHMPVCIYIYMFTHMSTYIHAHTHIHMYTHIYIINLLIGFWI